MTPSSRQSPRPGPTARWLSGAEVERVLDPDTVIAAVELALRQHAEGAPPQGILGVPVAGGGFHLKTGVIRLGERAYFAAKLNGNFPGNPGRGLPTIQGVILLSEAGTGRVLAMMDSIRITALRTAAATAVAARHLARPDAHAVAIAGCGVQARAQITALSRVRRLERVAAFDLDPDRSARFASALSEQLGILVTPVRDLAAALAGSDICITCTPSTTPILTRDMVFPGTFVAGVGADSESKSELAPDLLAAATVVVDVLDQAATIGDLHHAIAAGVLDRSMVHAELGQVVTGARRGRRDDTEITVFDSTGMGIQDAAAAAFAYEKALATDRGISLEL